MARILGVGTAPGKGWVTLELDAPRFNMWLAAEIVGSQMSISKGVRVFGNKLFEKIKEKTPVVTGTAKKGWEFRTKGLSKKNPYIVIANGVFYIVPLEFGHSKVKAPAGMVRVSMKEMMGKFKWQIRRELAKEKAMWRAGLGAARVGGLPSVIVGVY